MTTITRTKTQTIHRFIDRNRLDLGLLVAAILQAIVIQLWFQYDVINLFSPKEYMEEIWCQFGFFDEDLPVKVLSDGDIEIVDKLDEKPLLIDAPEWILLGASAPIDLNPNKINYTSEAINAEVEGALTLEIIVADNGSVLQVRSIGRKLGYGLDERTLESYRSKKFYPAFLNGKAVTVKTWEYVRFKLESPQSQ